MAWLAGGSSLATVVQRLQGAGGAAYSGDWVAAAAGGAAAAGKAVEYFAKTKTGLKDALDKVGKKVLPTPTAIIDGAMLAIFLVDLLNGLSSPDTGSAFSTAKDKYENVKLNLEAASPDELRWTGEAADAYKAMNDTLRSLVQQMEDLDKQMKDLVADQAGKVKQAHMCVTVSTLVLTGCLGRESWFPARSMAPCRRGAVRVVGQVPSCPAASRPGRSRAGRPPTRGAR